PAHDGTGRSGPARGSVVYELRAATGAVRTRDRLRMRRRLGPGCGASGAVADRARNAQIVDDVVAALGRGRNCLVLTRRVAHLDVLAARLAQRGHEALVLQGGLSVTERRATVSRVAEAPAGDGGLVSGTTPFIGEGFDAPALDTLFLVGPVSFDGLLIQCAGRVVRAAPGKDAAEVHDYHDPAVPIIATSLQRRMPGYRALGFVQR